MNKRILCWTLLIALIIGVGFGGSATAETTAGGDTQADQAAQTQPVAIEVTKMVVLSETAPVFKGRGADTGKVGAFRAGQKLRAAYEQDGFVAIFSTNKEGEQPEGEAMGYVMVSAVADGTSTETDLTAANDKEAVSAATAQAEPVVLQVTKIMAFCEPTAVFKSRSTDSAKVGGFNAGQQIRVAYEKDDYVAIFPANKEGKQPESEAMGYVLVGKVVTLDQAPDMKPVPAVVAAPSRPVVPRPLTLQGAIDYALANNLEAAVARQDVTVQEEVTSGAMWSLMPQLMVEFERSWKDRDVPSRYTNAATGETSLEPSISTDRDLSRASATLSYDLLNLSINVFRYHQEKMRIDVDQSRLDRVRQDVAMDVTMAYMQALMAREAVRLGADLSEKVKVRYRQINEQVNRKQTRELEGLEKEARYLGLMLQIKQYERRLNTAKGRLAELMGVKNVDRIELASMELSPLGSEMELDLDRLWRMALDNRPELRSLKLEKEISAKDASIALARAFPTLSVYGRYDYDSNSYLEEDAWFTAGLRVSWDLFSIPRQFSERNAANARAMLMDRRYDAMAGAVYTQVRLALVNYKHDLEDYELVEDLAETRDRLVKAARSHVKSGRANDDLLVEAEQRFLSAYLDFLNTRVHLVSSRAQLLNSMGLIWGKETPKADNI